MKIKFGFMKEKGIENVQLFNCWSRFIRFGICQTGNGCRQEGACDRQAPEHCRQRLYGGY